MRIAIRINQNTPKERMIGFYYTKEKMFYKEVRESKHLFKKFDAWGIDSDYFTDVLLPNNCLIKINDLENRKMYSIKAEKFKKKAKYFYFKDQKQDHRAQIFCPRRHFNIEKDKDVPDSIEDLVKELHL